MEQIEVLTDTPMDDEDKKIYTDMGYRLAFTVSNADTGEYTYTFMRG